eukprot:m.90083 g.90083  ORF g.90083 m.90083 type:complete len:599 (+) comp11807_c0_seq1:187-1983(+)
MPPRQKRQKPNDACGCGSGDKYKKCCMKKDMSAAQERATTTEIEKVRDKTIKKLAIKHDEAKHFFRKQEYGEAEKIWLSSLDDARSVKHTESEAAVLGNLGMVYLHTSRFEEAVRVLIPASDLAEEQQAKANHMGHLGLAYREVGDMENAVLFMNNALALAEKIGDTAGARIHASNLETCRPGGGAAAKAAAQAGLASAPADGHAARGSAPRKGARGGFGEFGASSSMVIRERLKTAHEEGKDAYTRGERREAIAIWEQCLKDSRTIRHEESEGAILGNLGMAYESIGEHTVAIHHLKNALAIVERTGDRNGLTNHLLNLAGSHASLKDYDASIACQRTALEVFERDGNLRSQEGVLGSIAITLATAGRHDEAIQSRLAALEIARKRNNPRDEGAVLSAIGLSYFTVRNTLEAERYFEMALGVLVECGDRQGEATVRGNLGLVLTALGKHDEAMQSHRDALEITREIGDRRGEGNNLGNLGVACLSAGLLEASIEHCRSSLPIVQSLGDRKTEGRALGTMGAAYLKMASIDNAIVHLKTALDIANEVGDTSSAANHKENLSIAFANCGMAVQLNAGDGGDDEVPGEIIAVTAAPEVVD